MYLQIAEKLNVPVAIAEYEGKSPIRDDAPQGGLKFMWTERFAVSKFEIFGDFFEVESVDKIRNVKVSR
jgi:hypothetical protein